MKKFYTLFIFVIILLGCKEEEPLKPTQEPIIINDTGEILEFKIEPVSENELNIQFKPIDGNPLDLLIILSQTGDTLAIGKIEFDTNLGYEAISITYPFDANKKYIIQVLTKVKNQSRELYHLPEYMHIYVANFVYEKVVEYDRYPIGFDISPSRETIFIQVYSDNKFSLLQYNIDQVQATIYKDTEAMEFLRSISDDEVILASHYFSDRFLLGDSLALCRFNLTNHEKSFIDWGSSGYGRFSRVVDNHILVTNPIWTTRTASLINLKNTSKVTTYPLSSLDYRYIREYNHDNIYYKNWIVDLNTGGFQEFLYSDTLGLHSFDETNEYAFLNNNVDTGFSLVIYHKDKLIYNGLVNIPVGLGGTIKIRDNKLIFLSKYGFGKEYNISGFYSLDLENGNETLVQCDNSVQYEFFSVGDNQIYSIREDGLYRITIN